MPSNPPVSESEKALMDAFKKFDVNGDGKIQEGEFNKLMKSLGSFSQKEIKRLFSEADTDKSGGVDWREFIKWICTGAATNTMSASSAASFARLLQHEHRDEAIFAEQALVSKQVTAYLKESTNIDADENEERKRKQLKMKRQKNPQDLEALTKNIDMSVDDNYDGFILPIPATTEGATALMRHYLMNGSNKPLHAKFVNYLTTAFTQAYKARHPKPVVVAGTPKPGRVIVVGDTHGQLPDVLHILNQFGTPTASNRYLFNGDMVDRGAYGVEILMILFAYFIADPECMIIHRGNHENEDMNALDCDSGGGFIDEVMRKYGLVAYRRFVTAFKAFSLCSVIEKEIFVVHGGLPRVSGMSIDYINTIDHSGVTAPHPQAADIKDQVFTDLVWSDPTDTAGKYKSDRGIGIKFGHDITTKFCMQNRLRFVIRSHQVPNNGRGYMKQHEGRCVTIFSASNYCGDSGNYGAVLVLDSQYFPRYEIVEHYAPPLEEMPKVFGIGAEVEKEKVSIEQQKTESDAATSAKRAERELERMIIGIIDKKPALWAHVVDMSLRHAVEVTAFKELMCDLVDSTVPWDEGVKQWGILDSSGKIDLDKVLSRWVVHMDSEKYTNFLSSAVKSVYEAVMGLDMDLDKTLKMFDQDGDGTVDVKEVRQVLGMFDLGLTSTQLDRLTGKFFSEIAKGAADKGGESAVKMNVQDFLGRFTVVYNSSKAAGESKIEPWIAQALGAIGRLIIKTPAEDLVSEMEKAAVKIQKCFRGTSARKEMVSKRKTAKPDGIDPEKDKEKEVEHAASQAPHSRKSLQVFKSKTAPAGPSVSRVRSSQGEGLTATSASQHSTSKMVRLFRAMDSSGDGILQVEEFVNGLDSVPGIHDLEVDGKPLTRDRLMAVAQVVDADGNGNGTINYMEFLKAFESSDSGNGDIANSLAEDITTVLFRSRLAIRMGCRYFDEDGTGKVRAEELEKVLHGVNSVLARPQRMLTSAQIAFLVEALKEESPDEEEAIVDYDAFLRAFVILDTARDGAVIKHFT